MHTLTHNIFHTKRPPHDGHHCQGWEALFSTPSIGMSDGFAPFEPRKSIITRSVQCRGGSEVCLWGFSQNCRHFSVRSSAHLPRTTASSSAVSLDGAVWLNYANELLIRTFPDFPIPSDSVLEGWHWGRWWWWCYCYCLMAPIVAKQRQK